MKFLEKVPSSKNEYRADILSDIVMDLHVSGLLTDRESDLVRARIKKKVSKELGAMTDKQRLQFCRAYAAEQKAKGKSPFQPS